MRPTLEIRSIAHRKLPSGTELFSPHWIVRGDRPGKKVYVQSGNHGGELAGHGALWALLALLGGEDVAGEIHLLPQVNPMSFNAKIGDWQAGVFDLNTGSNWNRVFKLLARRAGEPDDGRVDVDAFARRHRDRAWPEVRAAFQRELSDAVAALSERLGERGLDARDAFALTLQGISCDADIVLDLHTGDVAPRYLYAPPWRPEAMRALDIPHVLLLDDRFAGAMDEATICPWLMLARAFADLGRAVVPDVEGYTVELGSIETVARDDMRRDALGIANFLRAHGVLGGARRDGTLRRRLCAIGNYLGYVAPESGLAVFEKGPGDDVRAGEVVARILCAERVRGFATEEAEVPIVAARDGVLITRHASPVVYRGLVLFKTMTDVEELP
ncbi:MAG: succinylglutamate desuccinylase/aspartoacylase family protein [Acidobacteriota bacterium]